MQSPVDFSVLVFRAPRKESVFLFTTSFAWMGAGPKRPLSSDDRFRRRVCPREPAVCASVMLKERKKSAGTKPGKWLVTMLGLQVRAAQSQDERIQVREVPKLRFRTIECIDPVPRTPSRTPTQESEAPLRSEPESARSFWSLWSARNPHFMRSGGP